MPEGFAGSSVAEQAVGTDVDEVRVLVFLASTTWAVARPAMQEIARIVESILENLLSLSCTCHNLTNSYCIFSFLSRQEDTDDASPVFMPDFVHSHSIERSIWALSHISQYRLAGTG